MWACNAQAKARVFSCLTAQKSLGLETSVGVRNFTWQSPWNPGGASHHLEASCWARSSQNATACQWAQWRTLGLVRPSLMMWEPIAILLLASVLSTRGSWWSSSSQHGTTYRVIYRIWFLWPWSGSGSRWPGWDFRPGSPGGGWNFTGAFSKCRLLWIHRPCCSVDRSIRSLDGLSFGQEDIHAWGQ